MSAKGRPWVEQGEQNSEYVPTTLVEQVLSAVDGHESVFESHLPLVLDALNFFVQSNHDVIVATCTLFSVTPSAPLVVIVVEIIVWVVQVRIDGVLVSLGCWCLLGRCRAPRGGRCDNRLGRRLAGGLRCSGRGSLYSVVRVSVESSPDSWKMRMRMPMPLVLAVVEVARVTLGTDWQLVSSLGLE